MPDERSLSSFFLLSFSETMYTICSTLSVGLPVQETSHACQASKYITSIN